VGQGLIVACLALLRNLRRWAEENHSNVLR